MTMMHRATIASVSLVALALASCSTRRPPPRSRPAPIVVAPPVAALAPAAYISTAASIDLLVVRASDLALDRSRNARLRALAAGLGEAHRGLAGQLSLAGRRVDALPAARLLPREAQRLEWLASQQPFDTTYLRQMIVTHEQSLALHAAFAARGASPTLRPVAANGARVERAHLAVLGGL